MPRARQSRDWPSGNMGADSICRPIPDKGFRHPKESNPHLLAIKNIVSARHEDFEDLTHLWHDLDRSRPEAVAASSKSKLE